MKKIILIMVLGFLMSCGSDDVAFEPLSDTQSGSYANMLTIGDRLYIISSTDITTMDISDKTEPKEINRQILGNGIESLFYYAGQLFIGSRENLFIYDISNNGIPVEISQTSYDIFDGSCSSDPVVVNDSIAYVTLSTVEGGTCFRQPVNQLRLYDITDQSDPILINLVEMTEPKGLGLDGNWLFVCDDGLRVLDVSDPNNVTQIHHFSGLDTYDVIVQNGLLLVVGPENLYQFDYSNMSEMSMLSTIVL